MQICCPICTRTAVARILEECRIVAADKAEVRDLRAYICNGGHIFFLRRNDLSAVRSMVNGRTRRLGAPHKQRNTQTSEKHYRTQAHRPQPNASSKVHALVSRSPIGIR